VFKGIVTQDLGLYHSKAAQPAGLVADGLTARNTRSDRQALYSARSDHLGCGPTATGTWVDPLFLSWVIYSFLLHAHSFNTHEENSPPLSLSLGEKVLPCGEAFPIDPDPTEGIPGLTVMSSFIPFGYFIDSSSLSPWILLPRVHNVKEEDSIFGPWICWIDGGHSAMMSI
jgi:hypothetical protein